LRAKSATPRGSMTRENDMTQPEAHGDSRDAGSLAGRLAHVYWIGGGSGAGKSTIARRLAGRHGLRLYSTDEAMVGQADRWRPEDCPYLARWVKMSMDERWVDRSPQTMLETFHWFRGEGFGWIVEDLLALPPSRGLVVEQANAFMAGPAFDANPIGEPFDPEELVRRFEAGEAVDDLVFRSDQPEHRERRITREHPELVA
jgi:hypothetical protein